MIDIIIPIFNEGKQLLKLLKKIKFEIKIKKNIYLCYDFDQDNVFEYKTELELLVDNKFNLIFLKNPNKGPCTAVIEGLINSSSDCKVVYPADDFLNINLIEKMYYIFLDKQADIVVASRFIKGGSMKGCPFIKSILVRTASYTLFKLSSIPVRDASNGFRLFSNRLLKKVKIESKLGFAYSLELLVKCNRLKMAIEEVPAKWEERSVGKSNFKILNWINEYLRWYIYGLKTSWFKKKHPINLYYD